MTDLGMLLEESVGVTPRAEDRETWIAELFDRHYDGLCDLAYLILRDRHLAEEIVMDALIKTYAGFGRIRDRDRSHIYLRRAVINLCRSRIRRKVLERKVNAQEHAREQRRPPDWSPDVHEDARELWNAVAQLPLRQRACVVLRYQQDLPEQEIAAILECSPSTVRSQLTRARAKLQARLGGER